MHLLGRLAAPAGAAVGAANDSAGSLPHVQLWGICEWLPLPAGIVRMEGVKACVTYAMADVLMRLYGWRGYLGVRNLDARLVGHVSGYRCQAGIVRT